MHKDRPVPVNGNVDIYSLI